VLGWAGSSATPRSSTSCSADADEKAYAAAFVLLMIVLGLNAIVTRLTARRAAGERDGARLPAGPDSGDTMDPLMPPPVRRIASTATRNVDPAAAGPPTAHAPRRAPHRLHSAGRPHRAQVRERMRIESVWLAYGENWVVRDVSLPVRQGEVLALIGPRAAARRRCCAR
jgi:ABC-type multidrug transport system fused ATPase/permease subunit